MNNHTTKELEFAPAESAQRERATYAFYQPPAQGGNDGCTACYGLGWRLAHEHIERCAPCDVYPDNHTAARAAAETLANMYALLHPGEHLARGYGFRPFVLHPLADPTDVCPDCGAGLTSVEAGYDRYGTVTLEERILRIDDERFSDEGNGPHYLWCGDCDRAYLAPGEMLDDR